MTIIPSVSPPLPTKSRWVRRLTTADPFKWLSLGYRGFRQPARDEHCLRLDRLRGFGRAGRRPHRIGTRLILFPAFAGFMVVGPILAVGLYEKSRRIEEGLPLRWANLFFVSPRSGGQILFTGVLLCLLMMLWMRAAVLIYALFFGLVPFPGLDHIAKMLFTTDVGWAMLVVGTAVGGLFAAFSFAISAFSIPMLVNEPIDALTAMGSSMALVWNNLRVLLIWAGIVLVLFLLSLASGMLGLIVVYPLLGHATWHAYRAVRPDAE